MMEKVKVKCDRCGIMVDGLRNETHTVGYYSQKGWSSMMNSDEENVCDQCMMADSRYQKIYEVK